MEAKLKRKLSSTEIVHHDDENGENNSGDNLILEMGLRNHLNNHHKHSLKNPPVHHCGRRKWTDEEKQAFKSKEELQ